MFFHTCSAKDLEETDLTTEQLSALLLTSLAEIHANAEMFGGVESTSFKSKYKQIDRRGKKFCKETWGEGYKGYTYVFVRNDLSDSQKAVQGGHAAMESQRKFSPDKHPSLVYLKVRDEKKLKGVIQELIDNDISFTLFRDDLYDEEITAVATEPLYDDRRDVLKRYSLL